MNLLLDTHLLLWFALLSPRLSRAACELIQNPRNLIYFSSVSIWEVAIKTSLGRADFNVDAARLQQQLLADGLVEISLTGRDSLGVAALPAIHRDLFDRVLIAQAETRGLTFVTADKIAAKYPGKILRV